MANVSMEIDGETQRFLKQAACNPGRALTLSQVRSSALRIRDALHGPVNGYLDLAHFLGRMGLTAGKVAGEIEFVGFSVGRRPLRGQNFFLNLRVRGVLVSVRGQVDITNIVRIKCQRFPIRNRTICRACFADAMLMLSKEKTFVERPIYKTRFSNNI